MIETVRLKNYKGFRDFTLRTGRKAVLVGPNNAGKTTLVQALRLTSVLLKHAKKTNAAAPLVDDFWPDGARRVQGHWLSSVRAKETAWHKDENIRFEFRDRPAGIEVQFAFGPLLRVVWPVDDPPFVYIEKEAGVVARTTAVVQNCAPSIGVVPTLVPIEHRESVLSGSHVQSSIGTRLTSRHFRNQMFQIRAASPSDFDDLCNFMLANTPEISDLSLVESFGAGSHELDLYYVEALSATEKEIFWAGDGLQIWLQVLLHVWSNRDTDTLILDEPDVFLHPDLQRRLVSVLDDITGQVIVATHAPEILAEVDRDSVVWVDRSREESLRPKDRDGLSKLNVSLGSGFDLGLARAMRSRTALFVDGADMKVMRNLARVVGAKNLWGERGLAVIPVAGGFSTWRQIEPFVTLSRQLLGDSVKIFLVSGRGYRSRTELDQIRERFTHAPLHVHICERKELDNYVLVESAIARVAGISKGQVGELLEASVESFREEACAAYCAQRQRASSSENEPLTVLTHAMQEFDLAWRDRAFRLSLVNPQVVLARVSQGAQQLGGSAVSGRTVSGQMQAAKVDAEIRDLLGLIEETL